MFSNYYICDIIFLLMQFVVVWVKLVHLLINNKTILIPR